MAGSRKWFNMFPYSNYQIYNLDYLLQKYGEQDERIKKVEEKNDEQDVRLDADEADISQLQEDMTNAKDDISDLKTSVQTAEGDIDALEGRMDTAEGKISDLETLTSGDHDDIVDLKPRVTQAELDIDSLEGRMGAVELKNGQQDNDIAGLDSRVTDLENESAVIANPGGSGANLNTISIDNVTYVIPSGGGGGGGSSVTPNPAGTPTDTLDKVDIDGTIYGMPLTSADVTAIEGDIDDLQDDVSDIQDTLENDINYLTSWNGFSQDFEGAADNTVQDISPIYNLVITEPGMYLFTINSTFDTRNYGSTPRDIGLYLRRYHTDDPQDPGQNLAMVKGHVNGSENAMITQAYNMSLSYVLVLTGTEIHDDSFNGFKTSFRCQSSTTKNVEISAYPTCVKLNGVDLDPYTP